MQLWNGLVWGKSSMATDPTFRGHLGPTATESTSAWTPINRTRPVNPGGGGVGDRTTAPTRPPNVVFLVLDDVGFAQIGCYGSDIATPHMDALAAGGLRYTNFHVTPMCSPTRASLLTGRNHHAVGLGVVTEFAVGYPGYTGRLSRRAATIAELVRPQGYNTFAVGKWHLMPLAEASGAGPFDAWPQQRGFDRWYGFPSGYADQWNPELFDGNQAIERPDTPGYHLTEDLVDRAIGYVEDQQVASPDKPFLLYVAPGAAHWPHQAPPEYIDRYRGCYDEGWDITRERWLAKQIANGIVPPGTPLPPRNDDCPAWDELTADERRVASRHMEVFAGFMAHTDAQIGRLVDYLRVTGQLDNTAIFLLSDNGASNEGTRLGCVNVYKAYSARVPEPLAVSLEALDRLGDATTNAHYPIGWAQAGNTPFRRYKKDTHGGGVRAPLVVHWPARISTPALCHQYHHVVDIVPTILEELGIDAPRILHDVPQIPIHGTSFSYTFDNPTAPTRKDTQYYEMLGNRAIWHRGWKAVANHTSGTPFATDRWELYDLTDDPTELHDRATAEPTRLRTMIDHWWAEAGKYDVLPLDDRDASFLRNPRRPGGRTHFTYRPRTMRVERHNVPSVGNRSHTITAFVQVPTGGAEGVLLAVGNRFGGYTFYLQNGRLIYEYNFSEIRYRVTSDRTVVPGDRCLAFAFVSTGRGQGTGTIAIDGNAVGVIAMPEMWPFTAAQAGLHCGRDPGSTVTEAYNAPFAFTGTIDRVEVVLGDERSADPAQMTRAAMAEQ